MEYKVVDAVLKKKQRVSKYKKLLEDLPFSTIDSKGNINGKALEFEKKSSIFSCRLQAIKMGVRIRYCMSETESYLVFKLKAEEKPKKKHS